jgi:hypothetical protein
MKAGRSPAKLKSRGVKVDLERHANQGGQGGCKEIDDAESKDYITGIVVQPSLSI